MHQARHAKRDFSSRERERERERMSGERKEQQQQQQHSAERKQFNELQTKYFETTQKLKQLQSQFQQKHVDKQRALLTAKELSSSSSSNASGEGGGPQANLYKPLGRGFVLRSRQQIEKELSETVKKAEKMMDDCQNQKTFLEGKTQEIERNLRELLQGNEGLQRELHEAGLLGGGML